MAKLVHEYNAWYEGFEKRVYQGEEIPLMKEKVGLFGSLRIYESERMKPGESFIVFEADDYEAGAVFRLQTSCGRLEFSDLKVEIHTHDGKNKYFFKTGSEENHSM